MRSLRAIGRELLRVPLFYKILIANGVIVVVGVIAGSVLTLEMVRADPNRPIAEVVAIFAIAGVGVSVLVNAIILRLALEPLNILEATAARIQRGDTRARAIRSPLTDRNLEHLIEVFNGMLDNQSRYRARLRSAAARALGAAEEERKRIARDLHDETAQDLAALLIRLRLARGLDDPEAREQLLEQVRAEITESLEGVRRIAKGLRPPALDELGLVPAIESHARSLGESYGFAIRVDADPLDGVLTPEAELALYRIAQEALSNVARHADARRATIRLRRMDGRVIMLIVDNGSGFQTAETMRRDGAGLGLFGMQERAAYLGGTVHVRSRPGVGTVVRAEIPGMQSTPVPF